MNTPAYYIRYDGARHDIYTKAQLCANNSGQPQQIWAEKNPDNPAHSGLDSLFRDHKWWVLEATVEPQPDYPGVAR